MTYKQKPAYLFLTFLLFSAPSVAEQQWIDVHFHVVGDKGKLEDFEAAAERVIEVMDDANIEKALLMSPPRPFYSFDLDELAVVEKQHPSRLALVGGGGSLNPMIQKAAHDGATTDETKKKFEAIADGLVAKSAKAFGEMTAHHVSLNPGHGYEWVEPDHELFLLLADIAARHNIPIDLHFDPIPEDVYTPMELSSPKNPKVLKENVAAFERLLAHNREAKIVWAHAGSDPVGFYTPDLVRRLMQKHTNLYCSIRTTHRLNDRMRHPMRGINDEWIDLVRDFPNRFVMGTDSFVITPNYTGPKGPRILSRKTRVQREGANEVPSYLDDELARKVGRDNAIRIYRLDSM